MNKKLLIAGGLIVVAASAATFIFLKKRKVNPTEEVTEEPTPEPEETNSDNYIPINVIKERIAKEAIEKPDFQDYVNDVINKNVHLFKPPYYISEEEIVNPEEEYEDYDVVTLTYYKDGVLADGDDILEPEDYVPTDFADKFGENEDEVNVVYVRNEKLETVFEILNQPYDTFYDMYKYIDDGGFDDV